MMACESISHDNNVSIMQTENDAEAIAAIVSSKVWTPEQQVEELTRRFKVLQSDIKFENISFKPNPDDVILAVPPKNGATWLLHLCHQIRVRGKELDFKSQDFVVTWIEVTEKILGIEPAAKPQPAKPHIFITHHLYHLVPIGGRRICCFRDQKDAAISAYHFFDSLLSLKGRVCLPIFAKFWVETTLEHRLKDLLIWWEHRHDDDLLLLFFEDLKEDHEDCVRQIAKFIGINLDEATIARVVHTTTHTEMLQHHSKFDSRRYAAMIAKRIGETLIPESEHTGRVRRGGGKSGEGEKLPAEIKQHIDQVWQEIVTSKLGFQDMNEMRLAWRQEQSMQTQ